MSAGLRAGGAGDLSLVDLGCGPGTWLRRVVDRAQQLGFAEITARGVDLVEDQICRARVLSQALARRMGVSLRFEVGDILERMAETDGAIDLCLCLYGVLNHLSPDDPPVVFSEAGRITGGKFVAILRAVGSMPTIYVNGVKATKAYHQDNVNGGLCIEFQDGSQTSVPSRLFSAAEIRSLPPRQRSSLSN